MENYSKIMKIVNDGNVIGEKTHPDLYIETLNNLENINLLLKDLYNEKLVLEINDMGKAFILYDNNSLINDNVSIYKEYYNIYNILNILYEKIDVIHVNEKFEKNNFLEKNLNNQEYIDELRKITKSEAKDLNGILNYIEKKLIDLGFLKKHNNELYFTENILIVYLSISEIKMAYNLNVEDNDDFNSVIFEGIEDEINE